MTSFADIAERLNPAVVNIDATMTGTASSRRRHDSSLPGGPEFERRSPAPDRDRRRGAAREPDSSSTRPVTSSRTIM